MWQNFPEPFLPYDIDYVTGYNKLVSEFQTGNMNLSKICCRKKIEMSTTIVNDLLIRHTLEPEVNEKVLKIRTNLERKL